MVARLYTDKPEYFSDIADEIRAVLGMAEVMPANAPQAEEQTFDGLFLAVTQTTTGTNTAAICRCVDGASCKQAQYAFSMELAGNSPLLKKRVEKRCIKVCAFRCLQKLYDTPLPWGSLTGIRPTRLLRELYETEGETQAEQMFSNVFDVRPEKLQLAREIVSVQQPVIEAAKPRQAEVYVGIPFCKTRCLYCSFAAEVLGKGEKLPGYLNALYEDIRRGAALLKEAGFCIGSLYVGGGTPTVLSAKELDRLLRFTLEQYAVQGLELTVEAGRPDTINAEKLAVMRERGVTRISVNPQTMNDATLTRIGRLHTAKEIEQAYAMARQAGFTNINMDVIAGLPGETAQDFQYTLDAVKALSPESLTVHTLAVKRSSRLKQQLEEYPLPSADTAEEMVHAGRETAKALGMLPYYMYRQKYMRGNLENVGYAKPGFVCVYNVNMMEELTSIMAHGAGAMSKRVFPGRECRVERVPNPKEVQVYGNKLDRLFEEKRRLFMQE